MNFSAAHHVREGGVSPHDFILITDQLSYKKNLNPLTLLTVVISIFLSDVRSDLAYLEFITQPPCIMYGSTVLTRGVVRCSGAWLLVHHLSALGTFMESSQWAGRAWGTFQVKVSRLQKKCSSFKVGRHQKVQVGHVCRCVCRCLAYLWMKLLKGWQISRESSHVPKHRHFSCNAGTSIYRSQFTLLTCEMPFLVCGAGNKVKVSELLSELVRHATLFWTSKMSLGDGLLLLKTELLRKYSAKTSCSGFFARSGGQHHHVSQAALGDCHGTGAAGNKPLAHPPWPAPAEPFLSLYDSAARVPSLLHGVKPKPEWYILQSLPRTLEKCNQVKQRERTSKWTF